MKNLELVMLLEAKKDFLLFRSAIVKAAFLYVSSFQAVEAYRIRRATDRRRMPE